MEPTNNNIPNVQISPDVLSTIAGVAAMEVEGVYSLVSTLSSNIKDLISKKSAGKGVSVSVDNNDVTISINFVIKYNYKIQDVALNVQNEVIRAISDMTGYNVAAVNINVRGVNIPKQQEVRKD